jgi:hypothetical protein
MSEIDDAPMRLTAAERSRVARAAALHRWAMERDRTAATAAMREAQQRKREDLVDPLRELSPEDRFRRAKQLHRSQLQLMAVKSAQAKRRKRATQDIPPGHVAGDTQDRPAGGDQEAGGDELK